MRCIYRLGMYATHALYIRPPYAIESRWPPRVRGMHAVHTPLAPWIRNSQVLIGDIIRSKLNTKCGRSPRFMRFARPSRSGDTGCWLLHRKWHSSLYNLLKKLYSRDVSDVFINLEILNTPLILVIMLLQDNNIFKKLTSGIMDSLTGFQDNLVQSWWPDFPTGVAGHVGALQFK